MGGREGSCLQKLIWVAPPHPQRRGVSSRLRRFIERGDSHEIEAQRGAGGTVFMWGPVRGAAARASFPRRKLKEISPPFVRLLSSTPQTRRPVLVPLPRAEF